MGWDSDHILFNIVRDKILKDRYAGCCYGYNTSLSPVIINYRGEVTTEERAEITALFPDSIRVEFQPYPDNFAGEEVTISVSGATKTHPLEVQLDNTTKSTLESIASDLIMISVNLSQIRIFLEKEEVLMKTLNNMTAISVALNQIRDSLENRSGTILDNKNSGV